jgi:hypothetical protein
MMEPCHLVVGGEMERQGESKIEMKSGLPRDSRLRHVSIFGASSETRLGGETDQGKRRKAFK